MKILNPPSPPFSLRPRAVSDPEGKGGLEGFESYFLGKGVGFFFRNLKKGVDNFGENR
jgi:hypothetical protein